MKKRNKKQVEISGENRRDLGHEPGKYCPCHVVVNRHLWANNQTDYTDQNIIIDKVLTQREQQIVMLASVGLSNKQIAVQLQISQWTVSTHLRRIFAKLNVDNRTAMAYRCSNFLHKH